MADTPKQAYPDLEAQRNFVLQGLAEFRESNMRATVRASYLKDFKVGAETGRNAQVSKELRDLQLQSDNAIIAIVKLEAELDRIDEEARNEAATQNTGD